MCYSAAFRPGYCVQNGLRNLLKISNEDLQCFNGCKLLNDNCINAYLRLVERRSLYYYPMIPSVYAFDTFFFTAWSVGKYEKVKKWTKNVNIFSRQMLLFPLHVENKIVGHWSLIIVLTKTQQIITYDSFGYHYQEMSNAVLMFLQAEAKARNVLLDQNKWLISGTPSGTPRQQNITDCGVYLCVFAETLSRKSKLLEANINFSSARRDLCTAVKRGRIWNETYENLSVDRNLVNNMFERIAASAGVPDWPIET